VPRSAPSESGLPPGVFSQVVIRVKLGAEPQFTNALAFALQLVSDVWEAPVSLLSCLRILPEPWRRWCTPRARPRRPRRTWGARWRMAPIGRPRAGRGDRQHGLRRPAAHHRRQRGDSRRRLRPHRRLDPLRGVTTPEEFADAVLFFASPWARSVTGQNLVVDGGLVMNWPTARAGPAP
jgi:hypothetical protein